MHCLDMLTEAESLLLEILLPQATNTTLGLAILKELPISI